MSVVNVSVSYSDLRRVAYHKVLNLEDPLCFLGNISGFRKKDAPTDLLLFFRFR